MHPAQIVHCHFKFKEWHVFVCECVFLSTLYTICERSAVKTDSPLYKGAGSGFGFAFTRGYPDTTQRSDKGPPTPGGWKWAAESEHMDQLVLGSL